MLGRRGNRAKKRSPVAFPGANNTNANCREHLVPVKTAASALAFLKRKICNLKIKEKIYKISIKISFSPSPNKKIKIKKERKHCLELN